MSLPGSADNNRRPLPGLAVITSPRGFTFLVASLSVFLLGLLFVCPPVTGYVLRTELARRVVGESADSDAQAAEASEVESLLLQGDAVRQAIREAGLGPEDENDVLAMDVIAERIRKQTYVEVTAESPSDVRVRLEFTGADRESARRFVDSLSHQFITSSALDVATDQTPVLPEQRADRWRVREARHYEKKARQKLDSYLDDLFTKIESKAASTAPEGSTAQPTIIANPEWLTQRRHLERLSADREKLLVSLNAAHPRVRELDAELAMAQRRLAETPQQIPDEQSTGVESAARTLQLDGDELLGAIDEFRELRVHHEQTIAGREQAEQAVAVVEANRSEKPRAATIWLMQPAQVARQIGGQPSFGRLLVLLLVSLAAGLGAVRWKQRSHSAGFSAASQQDQVLSLPAAHGAAEPHSDKPNQARRWRQAS